MSAGKYYIGIVTVLYNSYGVVEDFIESLAAQTGVKFKLYIIDNSPEADGLNFCLELAKIKDIDIRSIRNEFNAGISRGNNQGIREALLDGCDYVLLANNDICFNDPRTIHNLLARILATGANAAAPKIYYHDELQQPKIWYAGGYISYFRATTPHLGDRELDIGQYSIEKIVSYSPTCFLMIASSVFEQIGLMDEDYFVYYDDSDFICRFNRAALRLLYVPTVQISHKVSYSTGGALSSFTLYNLYKNRMIFIKKNVPMVIRPCAYVYTLISAFRAFVNAKNPGRRAVISGVSSGMRYL